MTTIRALYDFPCPTCRWPIALEAEADAVPEEKSTTRYPGCPAQLNDKRLVEAPRECPHCRTALPHEWLDAADLAAEALPDAAWRDAG